MKRTSFMAVILAALLGVTVISCDKGPKDAELQNTVTEQIATVPALAGMMVSVNDGVATLTGECADEAACELCVSTVKAIPGIKSVVNQCKLKEVEPEVIDSPVEEVPLEALQSAVNDVLKDNPGIAATIDDGVVVLTGSISSDKFRGMIQTLQSLEGVKRVNAEAVTVN